MNHGAGGSSIMIHLLQSALLIVLLSAVLPFQASAKDLSHRLGVGYKNQFSNEVPAVALQYYPGADLGLSVAIGVDTVKENSRFGAMAKLYRIIFQEDNVNFYMGAGAGLVTTEVNAKSESGFELLGYVGAEFFLPGLENLGFSFEAGPAITSVSSGVRFRTYGDSPLRAGIIFYF
jgi:hypothetical protein